jgi:hypothetical protein
MKEGRMSRKVFNMKIEGKCPRGTPGLRWEQ